MSLDIEAPSTDEQFYQLGKRIGALSAEIEKCSCAIGALQAPHVVADSDMERRNQLEKRRFELYQQRNSLLPEYARLKAAAVGKGNL